MLKNKDSVKNIEEYLISDLHQQEKYRAEQYEMMQENVIREENEDTQQDHN